MLRLSMPHSGYREAGQLQWQETKDIASRDTASGKDCETCSGLCHNTVKSKPLLRALSFFMRQGVPRQNFFLTLLWPKKAWLYLRVFGKALLMARSAVWPPLWQFSLVLVWRLSRGHKLFSPPCWQAGLCLAQLSTKHVLNSSTWVILLTWTWADEQWVVKKKQQILLFTHEALWLCMDTVICMNKTVSTNVCLNAWGKTVIPGNFTNKAPNKYFCYLVISCEDHR